MCSPHCLGYTSKKRMLPKNNHHAEEMAQRINIKDAEGTNIGCYYKCKECGFECATRVACVAHACREHTDKLIGPCKYCGSFYAHSADTMKHHVNDCAGSTTGSNTMMINLFCWSVCSLRVINIIVNKFSTYFK